MRPRGAWRGLAGSQRLVSAGEGGWESSGDTPHTLGHASRGSRGLDGPSALPSGHWRDAQPQSVRNVMVRAQTAIPEDRHPALRSTEPNQGVQATAASVRSCLAPAVRRA